MPDFRYGNYLSKNIKMKTTGKSIAILGLDSIGKTTQKDLLIEDFLKNEIKVESVEYPPDVLDTGDTSTTYRINQYLHHGNPEELDPLEFQHLSVMNKLQFEPRLKELLAENDVVVMENYIGTSVAQGIAEGLEKDRILSLNSSLIPADITFLLFGEPFTAAENEDWQAKEKRKKLSSALLSLKGEKEWDVIKGIHIIDANQAKEKVHLDIWSCLAGKVPKLLAL
jgi:thymidylate kinase